MEASFPGSEECKSFFPHYYEVSTDDRAEGRARVYDPKRDLEWHLGGNELATAQLFVSGRTYNEIVSTLKNKKALLVTVEGVKKFEAFAANCQLLHPTAGRVVSPNPIADSRLRKLEKLSSITLLQIDPERLLSRISAANCLFIALVGLLMALGSLFLVGQWPLFTTELTLQMHGWAWFETYILTILSGVFHEGGHALACRYYGVRVRQVALGVMYFLPVGWVKPDQREWNALPLHARIITILAGPFGSLAYGGLGVLFWFGLNSSPVGMYMILAGIYGATLTLLPVINGDGYLLLTEVLGTQNLRNEAMRSRLVRNTGSMSDKKRCLLRALAYATIIGQVSLFLLGLGLVGLIFYAVA